MRVFVVLSGFSCPVGVLSLRLCAMSFIRMLPFYIQLHCDPPGLLLFPAAGHNSVHHHDPAWHGDTAEEGTQTAGVVVQVVHGLTA